MSNQATSLTKENGRIRQVVRINKLTYCMEKFNRLRFIATLDRKLE